VTFFTIFLLSVYCSINPLSTAIFRFIHYVWQQILGRTATPVKIKITCRTAFDCRPYRSAASDPQIVPQLTIVRDAPKLGQSPSAIDFHFQIS
jgi:hypothetical protein